MTDMNHMQFLNEVALSDVEMLRYKESTYRGSWKAGGGRSAWFMVRRMLDRLLVLMKKPEDPPTWNMQNIDDTIEAIGRAGFSQEVGGGALASIKLPGTPYVTQQLLQHLRDCYVAENVFAKIRENPSGADGTVLAVLRDFRRYALLIESEMIARGVVEAEKAPRHDGPRGPVGPSGPNIMREERRVPRYSVGERTPEDGGQHASWFPWQRTGPVPSHLSPWYIQYGPNNHRLEPVVYELVLPTELVHMYVWLRAKDLSCWVIDMSRVPEDIRDFFPSLLLEQNAKEHEENRFSFMYELDQSDGKYKLAAMFQQQGWGRDA